jgi:hypothetical protein
MKYNMMEDGYEYNQEDLNELDSRMWDSDDD